jgi:acetyltransferase EpsM
MSKRLYIYGAGGHGIVVAELTIDSGNKPVGFLDDDQAKWGTRLLGIPVIGGLDVLKDGDLVALGIGINATRKMVGEQCLKMGAVLSAVVSPRAAVSRSARISPGAVVMAGAVVNALAVIGTGAVLNTGCTVDHECVIGDWAHIAPGVNLAGNVRVGEGTLVGIGSAVIPGVVIGPQLTIKAGSVITKDTPGS